ncbi:unnamed protein product [Ectocarpus fasciculatus]
MSHVEIAKRSVSEMMKAMMKTQPEGNDDLEAAQAALCALFRSENLAPSRVSCAALMGQTSSAWGGLYHPRGGFRAIAEELVDSIHASGGRVLTRAKTTSVIVGDERAEGVTVVRESGGGGGGNGSAAAAVNVMIAGDGLGSVISSIGVIDTFRGLLPRKSALTTAASGSATAAAGNGPAAGAGAAAGESVTALGEKDGEGLDPAGFRIGRRGRGCTCAWGCRETGWRTWTGLALTCTTFATRWWRVAAGGTSATRGSCRTGAG